MVSLDEALSFVRARFFDQPYRPQYFFRDKFEHTLRVVAWARRLLDGQPADGRALLLAAAFHDVGYTVDPADHPLHSARLCREFLSAHGEAPSFVDKVCAAIERHDDKPSIHRADTPLEQVLLIEADNLDERGALCVLRDALAVGCEAEPSYLGVYRRLLRHPMRREKFVCHTEACKALWEEKFALYNAILRSLAQDLGLPEAETDADGGEEDCLDEADLRAGGL